MRPYIYVERVAEAVNKIPAYGGKAVTPPYPEGDLWVATFRDPGGNVARRVAAGARVNNDRTTIQALFPPAARAAIRGPLRRSAVSPIKRRPNRHHTSTAGYRGHPCALRS